MYIQEKKAHVLQMVEGQIVTEDLVEEVPFREEAERGFLLQMAFIRKLQ